MHKPDYSVVFPQDTVNRVDITIAPEDWRLMWDDMTDNFGEFGSSSGGERFGGDPGQMGPLEGDEAARPARDQGFAGPGAGGGVSLTDQNPVYRPCTLSFQGNTWRHVGIRFKGNSSLTSTWSSGIYKISFRLDTDKFEDDYPSIDDQRFYGFKELSLTSNFGDDSLIRETVVTDIFREAGVPAPQTAFYRVYVDHGEGSTYFGLYTLIEVPREPMLEAQFGDGSGNLYKPEGTGATFVTFVEDSFEKQTNKSEGDWSDVIAAIDALHADKSDPAVWRAGLEAVFNVEEFLRWLAVNTTIQNWDTYGSMSHNYYLYGDPTDNGRLAWIPWDNNLALNDEGMGGMDGGMGGGVPPEGVGAGGFMPPENVDLGDFAPPEGMNQGDFAPPNGMDNRGGGMGQGLSLDLSGVTESWPLIYYLSADDNLLEHVRAGRSGCHRRGFRRGVHTGAVSKGP